MIGVPLPVATIAVVWCEVLTFAELLAMSPRGTDLSPAPFTNAIEDLRSARVQPATFNFRKYVGPGEARVFWQQPERTYREWPEFLAEVEEDESSLAVLRDVLKDPPEQWGQRTNVFSRPGPAPSFVAIRTAPNGSLGRQRPGCANAISSKRCRILRPWPRLPA